MNEERINRRLAAVLAADVVNYSKLMRADEVGTHEALKTHRREFIDPKIAERDGRIVKLTGDGMLVEFASVVNAVACAAEIQREMQRRNAKIPEHCQLIFRIGINLGDVIVESDDIYGDGVNVAARMESVARPGGIAVSGAVRDHVANRLANVVFEDAGEQMLKNIEQPIRVYNVTFESEPQTRATPNQHRNAAEPSSGTSSSIPHTTRRQKHSFEKASSKYAVTYLNLRATIKRQVLRYTFSGPLLFIWILGAFSFIAMFDQPLLAVLWSGVMALLGSLMAAESIRSPRAQERLIRSLFRKQFQYETLTDQSLRAALEKQVNVLSEIAIKIFQMEKERGVDTHLQRLIAIAHSLVSLLWDTASEVEELERGLTLAGSIGANEASGVATGRKNISGSRRESSEDIARQVQQSRLSAESVGHHLDALMLKVFQTAQLPNNTLRNSQLAREYEEVVKKLKHDAESRRADRYVSSEVQDVREKLETGFSELNSAKAITVLRRLVYEYAQLQPLLERRRSTDLMSMSQVPVLVEESYRIALDLLGDALELMQASHPSEKKRLKAELAELRKKAAGMRDNEANKDRLILVDSVMSSHLDRLQIMEKQELRIEQLLHSVSLCEASLHRTHMELAAIKSAGSEISVRQATDGLQRTIDQAKDVQEELKKLGI